MTAEPALAPRVAAEPSRSYLMELAARLRQEARELTAAGVLPAAVEDGLAALPGQMRGAADFAGLVTAYRSAADRVAAGLDEGYELARKYRSMEEFWADASSQEAGASLGTYWDSYEHGLRRVRESELAAAYGAESAVLVNSGMSALDVAVRSLELRPGATLLVHVRAYFETTDYLDGVLAATGVRIVRADLSDPAEVSAALAATPAAVLAETVLNGPSCDLPRLDLLLAAGCPVVLDNSTLSHAVPAPTVGTGPLLVVESGSKYLSRLASSGVVYGWGAPAEAVRLTARRTGQQLQGRAVHRLRAGEIALCAARLALHAAGARTFRDELAGRLPGVSITDAGTGAAGRTDPLARWVAGGAHGCLLFVRLPVAAERAETAHRECVARWQATEPVARVRAGFGWTRTTARSYGRDPLNTALGQAFVRVSVGVEPAPEIRELARSFARAAAETGREVDPR